MKEKRFSKNFIDEMKKLYPQIWKFKTVGSEMQASDIPDHLFCINGKFVAIEFKIQRSGKIKIEPGQVREYNNIKKAGGLSFIIAYDEGRAQVHIHFSPLEIEMKKHIKMEWDASFYTIEKAVKTLIDLCWD